MRTLQYQDVQVFAGSYSLADPGRLLPLAINGIVKNEGYNNSDTYPLNDVALLKLASPISDIQPIRLVSDTDPGNLYSTSNALITGWGDTAQGSGRGSIDLLYAPISITPQVECVKDYGGSMIKDGMFCASAPHTDTCQGDSGGALAVFGKDKSLYEVGIVSWGSGCVQANLPGVYVAVSDYAGWIKLHMQ